VSIMAPYTGAVAVDYPAFYWLTCQRTSPVFGAVSSRRMTAAKSRLRRTFAALTRFHLWWR